MRFPRNVLALLLACAGMGSACKGGGTFVIVSIQAGTATPSGIRSIDLDLTLDGKSTTTTFTGPGGGDISLPTDGTLEIGSGAGDLAVTAHARGAGGQVLDTGTGHGPVARGSTTHIVVQLGTAPGDGGTGGTGGSDGGGGDAGGDANPGGDGGPTPPMVVADKDHFDFGTVVAGTPSAATVITVRNAGGQHTGALIVGVVDAVTFPTSADTCNGTQLDPGATCTVTVKFQPATAGAKLTTLRIGGTPGGTASVTLSGMGVDPGALAVVPGQRDFGPVAQGQATTETTFRVSNTGGAATTPLMVALTGSNAGEFHVGSDGCSNMMLQPSTTCTVGVTFTPSATAAVGGKSATLTVSAATGGTAVANLTGAALGPATLMVVPTDQDFGMVVQGLPSPEMQFTVTNGGGQASGALTASIAPPGEFAITSNTCTAALPPGGTCKVGIKMTPAGLGTRGATLTVSGSPGGAPTANLRGTGLPPGMVVISPSSKDFGTVDVGSPATIPFMVTNTGGGATTALTVMLSGAADFTLSADMCSGAVLAAGATCTFSVVFTPSTFGARAGAVLVSAATGGSSTAGLSGTGRDYVALTVNKAGTGGGTVAASGLFCANNVCTGQYARTSATAFQSVSVTASPDAFSTFTGWSGACTGTGTCNVTMDAAKTVTATFTIKTVHVTIIINAMAGHSGLVQSDDGSIVCNGTCGPITHNAAASMTLTAKPSGTSTFAGWASGPCVGTKPACTLPLTSDIVVTATFGPQSYMFVTSSLVVPGRLGGVAGADTECTNRATAAGLPGSYRAWISDKTTTTAIDANTRVGNGGWVRTDGRPFAPNLAALKNVSNQAVFYPPRVDENGFDLGPNRIVVATGGNNDGSNFGPQCGNYTTTAGSMYVGMGTSGAQYWSYDYLDSAGCATPAHLYCFRTDLAAAVAPAPVPNARHIFTSTLAFTPVSGMAAADAQCVTDAKNAGYTTFANFVALLSTSTTPAIARVNTVGTPWKRPDEVLVVLDPADLGKNNLLAPIDVSSAGLYASRAVWTGSNDVTKPSDGNSCNDWSSATSAATSYFGYPGFAQFPDWFNSGRLTCDTINLYLICAEK